MQMIHFLPALFVIVDQDPVAAFGDAPLGCHRGRGDHHPPQHGGVLGRGVVQVGEVAPGNKEDVDRRLGSNVYLPAGFHISHFRFQGKAAPF